MASSRYAFDFKLELRDVAGNLIGEYEDRTKSTLNNNGDPTTFGSMLNAAHSKWNISDLRTVENMTIPKVLDLNNTIHDSTAVNYAHVYLYGTDGNTTNDALTIKEIPAETSLTRVSKFINMNESDVFSATSWSLNKN